MDTALPFNLEDCLCVLGTSHSAELRQIIGVVKLMCCEGSMIINRVDRCMSIGHSQDARLLMRMQADRNFFDKMWYVSPLVAHNKVRERALVAGTDADHPCLNQRTCRAINSLLQQQQVSQKGLRCSAAGEGGNNHSLDNVVEEVSWLSQLNRNTANCEISIPCNFDMMDNILRSAAGAPIYIVVKWRDPKSVCMFIQDHGVHTTHKLALLQMHRVFIQQRRIAFRIGFVISTHQLRATVAVLHNLHYTHVCFMSSCGSVAAEGDTAARPRLRLMAWQRECSSVIDLDWSDYDLLMHPERAARQRGGAPRGEVNVDVHVGGPFVVDQIAVFLKSKSTLFSRMFLFFSETLLCMEQRIECTPEAPSRPTERMEHSAGLVYQPYPVGRTPQAAAAADLALIPVSPSSLPSSGMVRVLLTLSRERIAMGSPYNRIMDGAEALAHIVAHCVDDGAAHIAKSVRVHMQQSKQEREAMLVLDMERQKQNVVASEVGVGRVQQGDAADPAMWTRYSEQEPIPMDRFEDAVSVVPVVDSVHVMVDDKDEDGNQWE